MSRTPKLSRESFIKNGQQVSVEGVADSVAVGYVLELLPGKLSYMVFYGKQQAPAKYFGSPTREHAEQQIIKFLTAAGEAAQRKAQDRKQARQPYFDRISDGVTVRTYTTAGTAQLIRAALKAAFPGVKFSVTSDTFANGSSVDIRYQDGPSRAQVEAVTNAYEMGSFNSMEDIYEYGKPQTNVSESGELLRISYGAKYISSHRSYSESYGFFLNALDLREQPTLADQFPAFYRWHSAQRYQMQTSHGEKDGIYSVSSDSSHGDLEKFAAALRHQGHAVSVKESGPVVSVSVQCSSSSQAQQQPVQQWPQDETDRQFEAAERSWLAS